MPDRLKAGLNRPGTEGQNAAPGELDRCSALEIAQTLNAGDVSVPLAVARVLPAIARAIDVIAESLRSGGRLIYVGAGTSGRIAALDAAECPPTFGVDAKTVQYVMAGGEHALGRAVEGEEDSPDLGAYDMARKRLRKNDVVVGVAASGQTPYTVAAIEYARKKGAHTVSVTCNTGSLLEKAAEMAIVVEVGPEPVAGSTRMKAGTAQKLVLNMLSTGAMVRLGRVYGNLMVYVPPKNAKLTERGIGILQRAAGVDRSEAESGLKAAGRNVPVALVMLKRGVSKAEAEKRLAQAEGNVRKAIEGN